MYHLMVLSTLQYGDKIIVDSMEAIADTTAGFTDGIFTMVTNGVDIINQSGQILVDAVTRAALVPVVVTQRIITRREHAGNRRTGIEQAKKEGKYTGRKPIEVDEKVLRQVNCDRTTVNRVLYCYPFIHDLCYRDEDYQWHGYIRQARPHRGLEAYSGYYSTVAEFLVLSEEESCINLLYDK